MKVVALKPGFFGRLLAPGDEFEVPDGTEGAWFRPVEPDRPAEPSRRGSRPPGHPKAAKPEEE